jgi:hypothetical protein
MDVFRAGHTRRDGVFHALSNGDGESDRACRPETKRAAGAPVMRPDLQLAHRLDCRLLTVGGEVRNLNGHQLAGVVGDGGDQSAFSAAPVWQPTHLRIRARCDRIESTASEIGFHLRNVRDWRCAIPQGANESGALGVDERLLRFLFVGIEVTAELAVTCVLRKPGARHVDGGCVATMQVGKKL